MKKKPPFFQDFCGKYINFCFFFLGKFLSPHYVFNWAGLSAQLYTLCLEAGIMYHLVHTEKWAKGWAGLPLMWEVQTSLKEYRDLPHFKSEIGKEKTFLVKEKTFFSSKIWNCRHEKNFFFLVIKPFLFFFFSKIETFLKKPSFF